MLSDEYIVKSKEFSGRFMQGIPESKEIPFLPCKADSRDLSLLNKFIDSHCTGSSNDEIETLFSDKVGIAKSSVLQILSQIKERDTIKENNIKGIKESIEVKKIRILQIEDIYCGNYMEEPNREKVEVKKEITNLENGIRDEEKSCWKDLVQLKKDLMIIMSQYKENSRKKTLLSIGNNV